jgi:hypothetical protein
MGNVVMTVGDIEVYIKELWYKQPKDIKGFYGGTGRGGAILYHEMILGRELTPEEKEEFKDGFYEFNDGFLTYKGTYE